MAARQGYIPWDEYFMFSACVAAQRSKDPSTQVGAVIVDETPGVMKIVSSGYNGLCVGISDDSGLWGKDNPDPTKNKYMYVCHAEMNAITMSDRSTRGCSIYVTHFPCHNCSLQIIQAGIRRVVYANEWGNGKDTHTVSQYLLKQSGVDVIRYDGNRELTLRI